MFCICFDRMCEERKPHPFRVRFLLHVTTSVRRWTSPLHQDLDSCFYDSVKGTHRLARLSFSISHHLHNLARVTSGGHACPLSSKVWSTHRCDVWTELDIAYFLLLWKKSLALICHHSYNQRRRHRFPIFIFYSQLPSQVSTVGFSCKSTGIAIQHVF